MSKILQRLKRFLKRFLPPSSRTVNGRLDTIEQTMSGRLNTIEQKVNSIRTANERNIFYLTCKANEIHAVHTDTFLPYKNIYHGQAVVLVGAGPTLNYYTPIQNAAHIGVNGTYRNKSLKLEYLFVQDFADEGPGGVFSMDEIRALTCKKFVGQYITSLPDNMLSMIAPQYAAQYVGAKTYFVDDYFPGCTDYRIPINIEYYPIVDNASTIFAALQFALYTHPKQLYIVGCDCSYQYGQHFDSSQGASMHIDLVRKNWDLMKKHISTYYPDIEVFSVNPVGLVGLFNDIYTPEYLQFCKGTTDVASTNQSE